MKKKPLYKHLYVQVLFAIACGVILGHFWPETGASMKPLGDAFIKLIKMIIAPIIFCTVVGGIAGMEDMKKVGRVGGKALLYFEVVSTIALIIGLIVVNTLKPGAGMNIDPATLDTKALASYTTAAKSQSTVDFLMNVIPTTVIDAFAKGEILQVLLFSVLFGFALSSAGERGRDVVRFIEKVTHALFIVVALHHEGRADRRVRRDGLHDRQVRHRLAAAAGAADGQLLPHVPAVHLHRAGPDRALDRVQHLPLHRLHQGGAADRARHVVVRIGAAADDGKDGETGLLQVGRRPGDPDRLFVQPGWHVDLSDDGRDLRGAGDEHRI